MPKRCRRWRTDLHLAEASGERFYSAELYRLQGALCVHPSAGRKGDAEASLRKAIAIAQQQGAHTLERRARQSLAALAS